VKEYSFIHLWVKFQRNTIQTHCLVCVYLG